MTITNLQFSSTAALLHNVIVTGFLLLLLPRLWQTPGALLSPLNRIPGSWLHKLFQWPLVLAIARGRGHQQMQDLHKQYGPIVVLAPNMIAVSDPQAARHILVTEDWPKSNAIFSNSRLNPERPTLLAITEKKAYAVRKRLISSIFGLRYIRRLEPIMRDCIHVAMDQLHNACMQHGGEATVDIHHLMRALAVDIIGVTTFGESFHMVLHGSHPLPKKIEQKMLIAGILQFLPWLKYLPGFHDRDPYIDDFTRSIVERRRQIMKKEHRNDWLQKLLEAVDDSPNSAFQTSDLQDEVVVLLTAGSETTANAEIFLLMLLAKHPGKLALLHEEIDRFYSNPAEETTADKALQMPYLQACIDETMRLYAAMAGGSPREAPKDVTLLGYHIPKGTTVFPRTTTLHRDPSFWPQPDEFLPERWLDLTIRTRRGELPFYPFSAGSRICIGKHFALQEINLSVVSLLRKFTLEYVPGQDETTVLRVALRLSAGKYMVKVRE